MRIGKGGVRTVGEACAKTGWRIRTKGMAEKQVLARWTRQRTTVGRRWVSERLGMGDASGVSRSTGLVQAGRVAELERPRQRLLQSAIGAGKK